MHRRLLAASFLIASLAGVIAQANDDQLLSEARSVAAAMPPKLQALLQEQIAQSGPDGAIELCKDMAPKIAGDISESSGWKIKRVSLKVRNESRAVPDPWEKAALEAFDVRAKAGEPVAQLEKGERIGNEYRYLKALPVQAVCLSCHGPIEQIDPVVLGVLQQHYPNDHATGYAVGQIRGAISVRKSVAKD